MLTSSSVIRPTAPNSSNKHRLLHLERWDPIVVYRVWLERSSLSSQRPQSDPERQGVHLCTLSPSLSTCLYLNPGIFLLLFFPLSPQPSRQPCGCVTAGPPHQDLENFWLRHRPAKAHCSWLKAKWHYWPSNLHSRLVLTKSGDCKLKIPERGKWYHC